MNSLFLLLAYQNDFINFVRCTQFRAGVKKVTKFDDANMFMISWDVMFDLIWFTLSYLTDWITAKHGMKHLEVILLNWKRKNM